MSLKIEYSVPISIIFNTITDPMEIMKFTMCPAVSKLETGGEFSLYEGTI